MKGMHKICIKKASTGWGITLRTVSVASKPLQPGPQAIFYENKPFLNQSMASGQPLEIVQRSGPLCISE
jgi:hypothetical protein